MAHLTRDEILSSGIVSPTYQAAFEARPVDISGTDIASCRTSRAEHLQKLEHLYPIPGPIPDSVTETLHSAPTRDGKGILVKVYQPARAQPEGRKSPLIMMFSEGVWMENLNCRMFSRDLGAVCVTVEYRYMPHRSTQTHSKTNMPQSRARAPILYRRQRLLRRPSLGNLPRLHPQCRPSTWTHCRRRLSRRQYRCRSRPALPRQQALAPHHWSVLVRPRSSARHKRASPPQTCLHLPPAKHLRPRPQRRPPARRRRGHLRARNKFAPVGFVQSP
jgi:hypothetical protein